MAKKTSLSASLEDYLEAILELSSREEAIRVKNIAKLLTVRQPSVTSAMRALAEKGLIRYEPYGMILLTSKGRLIAKKISDRHAFLHRFLHDYLGTDTHEADTIACKIEHVVSDGVMERLAAFVAYVDAHKKNCPSWNFKASPSDH